MAIEIRPATDFADVRTLVGPKRPDANVCWCLSYRIPSRQNQQLHGTERGEFVKKLVAEDPRREFWRTTAASRLGGQRCTPARTRVSPPTGGSPTWTPGRCGPSGASGSGQGIAATESHTPCWREPWTWHGPTEHPSSKGIRWTTPGRKLDLTMAYVGTRKLFEDAGFTKAADTESVLHGFPRVLMRLDLAQ